jgi:hypothetical protein
MGVLAARVQEAAFSGGAFGHHGIVHEAIKRPDVQHPEVLAGEIGRGGIHLVHLAALVLGAKLIGGIGLVDYGSARRAGEQGQSRQNGQSCVHAKPQLCFPGTIVPNWGGSCKRPSTALV